MKILGISGSPRDKNTNYMLRTVLEATGQDYELILLKDKHIHHCRACGGCYKSPYRCKQDDEMQLLYPKLLKADSIVLGSPIHFDNVSDIMKNFMDRCLPFYFSQELKGKKAIILTVGNFHQLLEFDKNGRCKWHKEETQSAKNCLRSLESFCKHTGLEIVGKMFALHGDPTSKEKALVKLGNNLVKG